MSPGKRDNRKKVRKIAFRPEVEKHYIFCEGEQTEPLYFNGFKKIVDKDPIYKNSVLIEVRGVGAETLKVIEAAEKMVYELGIKDAQIWCVYDKDSFPAERFNRVSQKAEALNKQQANVVYRVGWSNQCIEYWFILHFALYEADNDRKYYRLFLHKKFQELGWHRYEKNNDELFNVLSEYGNPKQAIKWAKQRIQNFKGFTDSESAPATKVYELVEELAKFLPDDLRDKYI